MRGHDNDQICFKRRSDRIAARPVRKFEACAPAWGEIEKSLASRSSSKVERSLSRTFNTAFNLACNSHNSLTEVPLKSIFAM
jgi:hypothetical protein